MGASAVAGTLMAGLAEIPAGGVAENSRQASAATTDATTAATTAMTVSACPLQQRGPQA